MMTCRSCGKAKVVWTGSYSRLRPSCGACGAWDSAAIQEDPEPPPSAPATRTRAQDVGGEDEC